MIVGFGASFSHNQNGMTRVDMEAVKRVADRLDEVIIFRSTGPWSMRWLEKDYPSKNFHVKGKSSDWGPHAGLVPYDGIYSKVGYNAAKAAKGTAANQDGLKSGFANKQPLILTRAQIDEQMTRGEGSPARTAIERKIDIPDSKDLLLLAQRSGDRKTIAFRAVALADGRFEIRVYPPGKMIPSPALIMDKDRTGKIAEVFEVMTSNETGAGLPMTGDYDLFTICPSWGQYGSLAARDIVKPGIQNDDGKLHKGMAFRAGQGMDNVIDPTLNTMSRGGDFALRKTALKERMNGSAAGLGKGLSVPQSKVYFSPSENSEHGDMGNLTPRILRCINELNIAMGAVGDKASRRRVHHNAESHRNRAFGALTKHDMETAKDGDQYGDGFPLTVFQPRTLYSGAALSGQFKTTARYGDVSTLEDLEDFKSYAQALKASGYYVPKNWIWGV
jgi:hypothetical protein